MCGRLDILAEISVVSVRLQGVQVHSLRSVPCISLLDLIFGQCLIPTMSLFIRLKMDTQQISRKHSFSGSSLVLPTAQQESCAFQFSPSLGNNGRPFLTGHSERTTVAENSSNSQHPRLLWSLPQKRSNPNPSLGRVGGPEESDTRAFSGIYSTKRLKGVIKPPLSSSVALCNRVAASSWSRPLLDISEAKTQSLEQVDSAEGTDDLPGFGHPKCLQSPFEYAQDPVTRRFNQIAKNGIQCIDHNEPSCSGSSSGYFYFAPTNPSDKTKQALDAAHTVPRRQLSYVDPPGKPMPRSLHKSTGSWELRHEAKRHAKDCNIQPRSDSTLIAKAYHSEPIRSKPRLCLDLSEQKDEIKKAVSISKPHERQS